MIVNMIYVLVRGCLQTADFLSPRVITDYFTDLRAAFCGDVISLHFCVNNTQQWKNLPSFCSFKNVLL